LFDKIVQPERNTRQNSDNSEGHATLQHSQNKDSAKNQFVSDTITRPQITLQEDAQQDNNAALLSSSNRDINYKKLLIEKQTKRRQLQVKQDFCVAQAKNKHLEESLRDNKLRAINSRCLRNNYFDSNNKFSIKRQRSIQSIRSTSLNLYYGKNFKKYKNWI